MLAGALKWPKTRLNFLSLRLQERITDTGAISFAEALRLNSQLATLDLGGNQITRAGAEALDAQTLLGREIKAHWNAEVRGGRGGGVGGGGGDDGGGWAAPSLSSESATEFKMMDQTSVEVAVGKTVQVLEETPVEVVHDV